jgi:nucleoside-diphosphate-sugar epimerase
LIGAAATRSKSRRADDAREAVDHARLAEAMNDYGVHSLVFSSSCTVYGTPPTLPLTETHPLCAVNPYGQTKLTIELMLRDLARSDDRWRICLLRYFNPVGAHDSGLIGEDPNGIPNNLMSFVLKVAAGEFKELGVWGSDYPTHDGTGVRDYIHVVDLAVGHLRAVERLPKMRCDAINLGAGQGGSVIDVPLIKESEWLQTVDVSGAVMKPARLQWVEDARLGYYMNMCGGFSTTADASKVITHLLDGGILAKQEGEAFNPKVPPGSMIVIMTKPQVEPK